MSCTTADLTSPPPGPGAAATEPTAAEPEAAGPAAAPEVPACAREAGRDVSIFCAAGGQICEPAFQISCVAAEEQRLHVELTAGAGHCSEMRFNVYVDGELRAKSEVVGAAHSTGFLDAGALAAGQRTIAIRAEGQRGGCNDGQLFSWSATMRTELTAPGVDLAAPSAPPTAVR